MSWVSHPAWCEGRKILALITETWLRYASCQVIGMQVAESAMAWLEVHLFYIVRNTKYTEAFGSPVFRRRWYYFRGRCNSWAAGCTYAVTGPSTNRGDTGESANRAISKVKERKLHHNMLTKDGAAGSPGGEYCD